MNHILLQTTRFKQSQTAGSRWAVLVLLSLLVLSLLCTPALAKKPPTRDVAGSQDHPALGRIPGAVIGQFEHRRFGRLKYPLALTRRGIGEVGSAEGELWRIDYYLPGDLGPDGAAAVYRRNLERLDFRLLLDEEDPKGRISLTRVERRIGEDFPPLSRPIWILVGKGRLRGREATVVVYAYTVTTTWGKRDWVRLRIVEGKALDATLEVVKAERMASDIRSKGHVVLQGILFDHDSDRLKPKSRAAIAEIAKYLEAHPRVRLYVVGHTDNTGGYDYNRDLSRRRAAAVVRALVREHGIDAARLEPVGVGPVAPVASNATEEGRARNRRVELVER